MFGPIRKHALWLLPVMCAALAGCDVNGSALFAGAPPGADGDEPTAKIASTVGASVETPDCPTPDNADEFADQLLRLINIKRFEVGAVELDPALSAIAESYACAMIADDFFGHTHPTSGGIAERVSAAGYEYNVVGENLAAGIWTAPETFDAWLESPTHLDILIDPTFANIGIAVRYGGHYGIYWVLIMADPAD